MKFEFSTNNQQVVQSGSVILYDYNSDWVVDVEASDKFKFRIIVKFEFDANEKQHIKRKVIKDNKVELVCVNFGNTLGSGTVLPMEIATIQGKKLNLHLWVYVLGDNEGRRLEYTFLLEE